MTDEDKQKPEDDAYAAFRYGLVGDTPVAPRPHWRYVIFPIGHPLNKTVLREEFKQLRAMVYGEVMPPAYRQYLGPPPSDPKDRLYEGKRKGLLGLEAGPNHSDPKPRTTGKEQ